MKKLRLLVADADARHIKRVANHISACGGIEMAGIARDGNDALKQIAREKPDILLTDIQLPGLDGIMLLKDLQRTAHPPVSIVCTQFYSDACVMRACKYGAAYFLYKPLDFNRLPEIIMDCWRADAQTPHPRSSGAYDPIDRRVNRIRALLLELGIPARMSASLYLTEMLVKTDSLVQLRNLSKGLYADIAGSAGTTPSCVERSLRCAISSAFTRGCLQPDFSRKPTNKEFIQYLLRRVDEPETG